MARGRDWAKVHRKLTRSDLWLSEEFTRGQAWVDLILLAAFKPGFVRLRGVKVPYERGQIATAERFLVERWKWSRGKVRRFLRELEKEQQIVQQKSNASTVITIINYESYQGDGTADETANGTTNGTANGPQTGQQTDQSKERKELKEGKKEQEGDTPLPPSSKPVRRSKFTPPTLEEVAAYCQERGKGVSPEAFHAHYEANGWVQGSRAKPVVDWKACVRTWEHNRNGVTPRGSPPSGSAPRTRSGFEIVPME